MTSSLATVSYIGSTILFILSLGGLSNPETARRGNLFGIIGMALAVLATVFGPRVTPAGYPWIIAACLVGFASYVDSSVAFEGAEKSIHEMEIYIGILIGAITFSGSVIAFGKLSGKIGGK